MCGIVGYAGFHEAGLLERMLATIRHRGPDSAGDAELRESGIHLGARRLAIIDPEGGDQPFATADGRVTLVFNGEIYNHPELRTTLQARGRTFKSRCDTEVVLAAYLEWGDGAWSRMQGMFTVAIADARTAPARLLLIRDRVGIKPLYYVARDGKLLFGSELKALMVWDGLAPEVDLGAVTDYLALRYVPGPGSMFAGVHKLPPGHRLSFSAGEARIDSWWSAPDTALAAADMDEREATSALGEALRKAVARHLISDVPLGAFLSGGIDSGLLVALMGEQTGLPVNTFTIGFPDFPQQELERARLTARALGSRHTEIECRGSDFAALPDIVSFLDEPLGDAIVVPMYVLAREARKQVKVVFSGEGADELLGGYVFHRQLTNLFRLRRLAPGLLWHFASTFVAALPVGLLDRLFDYPGKLGSEGRKRVAALLRAMAGMPPEKAYRLAISLFEEADLSAPPLLGARTERFAPPVPGGGGTGRQAATTLQRLIGAQFRDWLPDDILMKLDKMTMANSLEGRVPFMDEEVILAAARIPDRFKLQRGSAKRVLREVAKGLLPEEIVDGRKAAFYIPIESYMEAPHMRDLLRMTLDPARLRRRGLFRPEWVRALRESKRSGGFLPLKRLFSIIMLELWFERFCPDASWA